MVFLLFSYKCQSLADLQMLDLLETLSQNPGEHTLHRNLNSERQHCVENNLQITYMQIVFF